MNQDPFSQAHPVTSESIKSEAIQTPDTATPEGTEGLECDQHCSIHRPLRYTSMAIIGLLGLLLVSLRVSPSLADHIPDELFSYVGLGYEGSCDKANFSSRASNDASCGSACHLSETYVGDAAASTCDSNRCGDAVAEGMLAVTDVADTKGDLAPFSASDVTVDDHLIPDDETSKAAAPFD